MSNPFVVGPIDTSTLLTGTFLLEDGEMLSHAIASGDWIAGGMAAFSTAMDLVAAVSDPIGTLFAMGFGWILEHIQPLKGWLNQLTGDPGAVAGFSGTWSNIDSFMSTLSADLQQMVGVDLVGMSGETIDAYRAFQRDLGVFIDAAAKWCSAVSIAMGVASVLVQIVHDIVRDAIAQIAGALCSYILEIVFTLGLAIPLVIEQATTRGASVAGRVSKHVNGLVDSATTLGRNASELSGVMSKGARHLENAKPKTGTPRPTADAPVVKPAADVPAVKPKPLTDGPYIKDGKPRGRPGPSGEAKLQFEKDVYNAQVGPDGVLREPYPPHSVIDWKPGEPRAGRVDFGHTEGNSYAKMFEKYKNGDISLDELRAFQSEASNFRIEKPGPNRSHVHE